MKRGLKARARDSELRDFYLGVRKWTEELVGNQGGASGHQQGVPG